jgi:hypothetical protein
MLSPEDVDTHLEPLQANDYCVDVIVLQESRFICVVRGTCYQINAKTYHLVKRFHEKSTISGMMKEYS